LSAGTYTATVTVTATGASGSPKTVNVTLTVNAPPPPPNLGLVGAWGFDETSGTVANDASGRGNTGTLSGPVRTTAGRYGSALTYDGVNDWVTVAHSQSLNLTSGVTMEAWVYPATVSGYRTAIIKEQTNGLTYALYPGNGNARPSAHIFTTTELQQQGPASLPVNAWSHVAATWDGTTLRLYVNGTQTASRALAGTMATSTRPLRFGGNAVWPEWFRGRLDEIRIYDRALTAAQVQSDMNTPIAGTGLGAGARASWSAHPR
jgi:hypothetical protein